MGTFSAKSHEVRRGWYVVDATDRTLGRLASELRGAHPRLGPEMSMGMSDDYPVAVQEGATIVRVGRALFGDRPAPGTPGAR